jgi:hypothetical protein
LTRHPGRIESQPNIVANRHQSIDENAFEAGAPGLDHQKSRRWRESTAPTLLPAQNILVGSCLAVPDSSAAT